MAKIDTYKVISFVLRIVSHIPFKAMYVLSDVLYCLVYYIVGYRKKIVRKNLSECFPNKSASELKNIERGFYHFLADNALESLKMATITEEELKRRWRFVNVEDVNSVLREGKSIALYMGHVGNWEWCTSMSLHSDENVKDVFIYHELRNEVMNRIFLDNRERMGAKSVEMRKTARYINETMQKGEVTIIGFIADQSPRKRDANHFVDFLNHRIPVLTGTEKIIKHYGLESWFLKVRRVKRGYYEAEFVKMHDDPKSLPDFELTRIYFNMLEDLIKAQPEIYLWSHNRFKHAEK